MLKRRPPSVALWILSLCFALPAFSAIFEVSVPPQKGERYASAGYRMWIPDGVKTLRAIIIKQHGCGRDGITYGDDLQWQELARKWDSALLGTRLTGTSTNCAEWSNPDLGTGRALLEALRQLGGRARHPELEYVPWALWGHSGGAFWCHAMTVRMPERVAGVFLQSGAITVTNGPAARVPILLNRGSNDFPVIIQRAETAFRMHRAMGGFWSLSVDPKSQYECGQSRSLAIPFFDSILSQRLPVPAPADGQAELMAMNSGNAWVGNLATHEIAPASAYKGEPLTACWFPNEKVARCWQEFCKTGLVKDTTPPSAPNRLRAVASDGVVLTWSATADLESGIKTFNVYRDGEKIGSYRTLMANPNSDAFQAANEGDEPEPVDPKMRFVDLTPPKGRHTYQITTVNGAGLESERSLPVEARIK